MTGRCCCGHPADEAITPLRQLPTALPPRAATALMACTSHAPNGLQPLFHVQRRSHPLHNPDPPSGSCAPGSLCCHAHCGPAPPGPARHNCGPRRQGRQVSSAPLNYTSITCSKCNLAPTSLGTWMHARNSAFGTDRPVLIARLTHPVPTGRCPVPPPRPRPSSLSRAPSPKPPARPLTTLTWARCRCGGQRTPWVRL